jgi:hypothetical protein
MNLAGQYDNQVRIGISRDKDPIQARKIRGRLETSAKLSGMSVAGETFKIRQGAVSTRKR